MRKFVLGAVAAAVMAFGMVAESEAAALVARIDISNQTMTVIQYGQVIHQWRVSTARRGYHTPRGVYRPTRLHRMWYSRKYEMSPMPWSVFFRGGFAIHGTNYIRSLGRPASHGCVRLDTANAAQFYALVQQEGSRNVRIVLVD